MSTQPTTQPPANQPQPDGRIDQAVAQLSTFNRRSRWLTWAVSAGGPLCLAALGTIAMTLYSMNGQVGALSKLPDDFKTFDAKFEKARDSIGSLEKSVAKLEDTPSKIAMLSSLPARVDAATQSLGEAMAKMSQYPNPKTAMDTLTHDIAAIDKQTKDLATALADQKRQLGGIDQQIRDTIRTTLAASSKPSGGRQMTLHVVLGKWSESAQDDGGTTFFFTVDFPAKYAERRLGSGIPTVVRADIVGTSLQALPGAVIDAEFADTGALLVHLWTKHPEVVQKLAPEPGIRAAIFLSGR